MTTEVYLFLHLFGVVLLFLSIGIWYGAAREMSLREANTTRRTFLAFNGLGGLLILISGFGLLAKIGYLSVIPTFAFIKLGVWVLVFLGLPFYLARSRANLLKLLLVNLVIFVAIYLGIFHA